MPTNVSVMYVIKIIKKEYGTHVPFPVNLLRLVLSKRNYQNSSEI